MNWCFDSCCCCERKVWILWSWIIRCIFWSVCRDVQKNESRDHFQDSVSVPSDATDFLDLLSKKSQQALLLSEWEESLTLLSCPPAAVLENHGLPLGHVYRAWQSSLSPSTYCCSAMLHEPQKCLRGKNISTFTFQIGWCHTSEECQTKGGKWNWQNSIKQINKKSKKKTTQTPNVHNAF